MFKHGIWKSNGTLIAQCQTDVEALANAKRLGGFYDEITWIVTPGNGENVYTPIRGDVIRYLRDRNLIAK